MRVEARKASLLAREGVKDLDLGLEAYMDVLQATCYGRAARAEGATRAGADFGGSCYP